MAKKAAAIVRPASPNWARLETLLTYNEPPENAFTGADAARQYGITRDVAYKRLTKLVQQGELQSGVFLSKQGKHTTYYWEKET